MDVVGTIEIDDAPVELPARRFLRDGGTRDHASEVQRESLLTVSVNDIPTMQIGCSADHLVELVCGRLYTEGLIAGLGEIDTLSICENSLRADVYLRDREADLSRRAARMVPTCCTNNVTLNDYFDAGEPLQPVTPIPWDAEWIFRAIDVFERDETLHRRTRGTHTAYLSNREGFLLVREDIGRHNALDKAVGSALLNGIDLSQCLLFTSGRVPTDMTAKTVRAKIPILASKSAATDKTIQMARDYNLTLICNANPESFDVFHNPIGSAQSTSSRLIANKNSIA